MFCFVFVLFFFFRFLSTPGTQILASDIIGIAGTINIIIDNFRRKVSIPVPALNIIHNYFEQDECKLYTLNIMVVMIEELIFHTRTQSLSKPFVVMHTFLIN